ncbi:hypothetical protein EDB83DRAFT_1932132 [Lactarius deliciosus]|nr:hypothetical protein EDB83DRAFT_1932132 [Lactarius deliciosus]
MVRLSDGSVASIFSAQLVGNSKWIKPKRQRTITLTFTPQQVGNYEAVLELTFYDRTRKANFVIERKLHGVAEEPISDRVTDWADDHASLSTDEEEELPDGDGTGILSRIKTGSMLASSGASAEMGHSQPRHLHSPLTSQRASRLSRLSKRKSDHWMGTILVS